MKWSPRSKRCGANSSNRWCSRWPFAILVAKPGLDGHDRGAKIVARTLRDAGFEVIYTGIRQRIEDIASIAVQEDVAVVGLSILSGAHLALTARTIEALRAADAADIAVVVGGTIPHADVPKLLSAGAAAVFPTGTPLDVLVRDIRALTGTAESDLRAPEESVRIGVMIGAERGDTARKVTRMACRHRMGRVRGPGHRVDAAGAQRLRRLTTVSLMGTRTAAHRTGYRGRAAAGAASDCAGAPGALDRTRRPVAGWRWASDRRTTGSSSDMLGLPYERPAAYTRDYLRCSTPPFAGPGTG